MDAKKKAEELAIWTSGGAIGLVPFAIKHWAGEFEKELLSAYSEGVRDGEVKAYEAAEWHNKVDAQMAGHSLGNHRLCKEHFKREATKLRGKA